jgi:DNA-binding response OmpR family regulator
METKKQILIADPDERVLIDLERVLQDAGYDTTTAWTVGQMQETIKRQHFDAMLVADHPPEMSCETILRQMRQFGCGTPVIVLEGRPRHPFAESYLLNLGAQAIAHKWEPRKVREAVEGILAPTRASTAKSAVAATRKVG